MINSWSSRKPDAFLWNEHHGFCEARHSRSRGGQADFISNGGAVAWTDDSKGLYLMRPRHPVLGSCLYKVSVGEDHGERHKVVMKCAEAYALATLPSSQPLDDDPGFRRYLLGLRIVARTHYLSENVKQINQAIEMIRDYLWSLYDGYDYNY